MKRANLQMIEEGVLGVRLPSSIWFILAHGPYFMQKKISLRITDKVNGQDITHMIVLWYYHLGQQCEENQALQDREPFLPRFALQSTAYTIPSACQGGQGLGLCTNREFSLQGPDDLRKTPSTSLDSAEEDETSW